MHELITNYIQLDKLQKIQDSFSGAAHVYSFCVDVNGRRLTELSGDKEKAKKILSSLSDEQLASILEAVMKSDVEDQIVEDTLNPNVKVACISIKIENTPVINWVILGEMSSNTGEISYTTTRERFYKGLDLIRIGSKIIFTEKRQAEDAILESRKSRNSEIEMKNTLQRSEAMTEIVQFLDSEIELQQITSEIIGIVGRMTGISHAYVMKPDKNNGSVEMIGSYIADGEKSVLEEHATQKIPEFLKTVERRVVISSGTRISEKLSRQFDKLHIRAITVFPITIKDEISMLACYLECRQEKEWNVEDLKFFNDATKIIQSILQKRIQKNSLKRSYESLEAVLDNVGSGIFVREEKTGKVLFTNRVLRNTFSKELKDGTLGNLFESGVKKAKDESYFEIYYSKKERWYDLHHTHIKWVDGSEVVLCAVYDVTDKKVYQKKIEQQAKNDFLTGLYNRMCCEKDLKHHIEQCMLNHTKGALLYLDLDDFKHINDGLGHQYGDVLLKAISHSMQRINGIEDTCYRMGGDEFVIIVREEAYQNLEAVLIKIKDIFSRPWYLKGADYYCTMSMGIVTFPDEGDTVTELIKKADIAMYEAKRSGKNKIARFSEDSDSLAYKRLGMEKNLRAATATEDGFEEFEIYYQPLIDVSREGNPCTGAEALLRWNNRELGFISPADFIPLAEYMGLINPIGTYVLKKACEALKYWNESGHEDYKVNVNLSVVQLLQSDIVDSIRSVIESTGINPKNLTLEVTESLAINDMARMKDILKQIRALGARIALDDFGTGYSSLNHIREIPLDIIKVDQSFVRDLSVNQYSQSFIKMVSELADAIDVNVCIEGIETESQFKVCKKMKVKLIQGYYFDKPMPLTLFEDKYL